MTNKLPKPIKQIIDANTSLQGISQHCERMLDLKRAVRHALPKEYAKHCQSVNLKGKSLLLYVDSALWSSRFRYLIPSILDNLRKYDKYQRINEIIIKTLKASLDEHFTKFRRGFGENSLEIIRVLEQTALGKAQLLRNSLLKLANTLKYKRDKSE